MSTGSYASKQDGSGAGLAGAAALLLGILVAVLGFFVFMMSSIVWMIPPQATDRQLGGAPDCHDRRMGASDSFPALTLRSR